MSFAQYVNAKTVAAKYDDRLGVHADFLKFVGDNTQFPDPLQNRKFHVVWGNFGKSMFGPGDFVLFRFTPSTLECVSIHKASTTFPLTGDITWTITDSGCVKDGEPVYWITGMRGQTVAYNYSVVPINF